MKKGYKISLGLGAIITGITPIATVVSCWGVLSFHSQRDPGTIVLGMRTEDINGWNKIIKAFKSKTGINVSIQLVSNQKAEYGTWDGTGSLPDLSIVDQNTAKDAMQGDKWFQQIDLNDIKSSEYDIVNDAPQEFNFMDDNIYQGNKVFGSFYDKDKEHGGGKDKLIALPYGYSSQGIFFNKNNLALGVDRPLYAYVPTKKTDGSFAKVKVSNNSSMKSIARFLKNSSTAQEVTADGVLSDDDISGKLRKSNPDSDWYSHGPLAMYQRLGSIGKSLGSVGEAGWIKDVGLPFELVASLGDDIFKNDILDDDKLRKFFPPNGKSSSEIFKKLYESYYGYFISDGTSSYASNPKAEGEPGEADVFWSGKGNIMLGYKWQMGMMSDNWYDKGTNSPGNFDNSIRVLPAPYGSLGIDALAIAKGVSEKKLIDVKKFLRFALDQSLTQNAYEITMQKTISPVVKAGIKQKNDIYTSDSSKNEKTRNLQFFESSKGEEYEGVKGGIMSASTKGIYDIYNGKYGGDGDGLKGSLRNRPKNYKEWKKKFDDVLPKVGYEIAILES